MIAFDFAMPGDWTEEALCAQIGGDRWFPEKGADTRTPKRICREQCPVLDECREFALRTRPAAGIWGGMSVRDREKWLREQRRAAA